MFPESLGFISCLHLGKRVYKKEASSVVLVAVVCVALQLPITSPRDLIILLPVCPLVCGEPLAPFLFSFNEKILPRSDKTVGLPSLPVFPPFPAFLIWQGYAKLTLPMFSSNMYL